MKKVSFIFSSVVMTAMMLSSCGSGASKEEGASKEVTIGKQVWMTENLNVDKFRNGDPIPEAKTDEEWKVYSNAEEAAWCYYRNDPANGEKYGKLYNWYAVNDPRGLAPVGYHIPTDEEWTALTDYLGGEEKAGVKMKSKNGWYDNGYGTNFGTNSCGFSGFPGGGRGISGTFDSIGKYGYWWSSSEGNTFNAWHRRLYCSGGGVYRNFNYRSRELSVRCLRD
jgi:uncharacterized protein (TIGR02145 family)